MPSSDVVSTNFALLGFQRSPSRSFTSHRQLKLTHSAGRRSWIAQPRLGRQCEHQASAGFVSASISITLQHSVQSPQRRDAVSSSIGASRDWLRCYVDEEDRQGKTGKGRQASEDRQAKTENPWCDD